MSILKQKKITLVGMHRDRELVLNGMQDLGCMHVLPILEAPQQIEKVINPINDDAYKALNFLTALESNRRQIKHKPDFDVESLIEECLDLKLKIRRCNDKRELLTERLLEIEPWGNIAYPPDTQLNGILLWYYILPLKYKHVLEKLKTPWQVVYCDNKNVYVVLLSETEPSDDILPVPRTHIGTKSKSTLLVELEETELALDELQTKRYGLTRFVYLLTMNINRANDKASLASASQKAFSDSDIIALHGWVPEKCVESVTRFAQQENIVCIVESPEAAETPPTLLEQSEDLEAAKDLAMFYQTPGYYGWDPSKLLLVSFSIFFAMILADAGYGLLLGAALGLFWKQLSASSKGRAYRILSMSLIGCSIVYGALVGSYFGLTPPSDSLLGALHVIDINDFNVMMKLSIIVGVVHLSIATISMAYVTKHKRSAIARLGWLGIFVGGLLYWLVDGNQTGQTVSYSMLGAGTLIIILFTSDRTIAKPSDHLYRLLDGIFGLKNALNAFGDILSYMRLFALGLASASLAITFNGLASDVYEAVNGGGLVLAIIIILIGHALNLILGLMAGVVHGLRLNYIEFYNWGQAEEGKPFETFARTETKDE